jgi:hypothetical protein
MLDQSGRSAPVEIGDRATVEARGFIVDLFVAQVCFASDRLDELELARGRRLLQIGDPPIAVAGGRAGAGALATTARREVDWRVDDATGGGAELEVGTELGAKAERG